LGMVHSPNADCLLSVSFFSAHFSCPTALTGSTGPTGHTGCKTGTRRYLR
jgi:hypothetical protein